MPVSESRACRGFAVGQGALRRCGNRPVIPCYMQTEVQSPAIREGLEDERGRLPMWGTSARQQLPLAVDQTTPLEEFLPLQRP